MGAANQKADRQRIDYQNEDVLSVKFFEDKGSILKRDNHVFNLNNVSKDALLPTTLSGLLDESQFGSTKDVQSLINSFRHGRMNEVQINGLLRFVVKNDYRDGFENEVPLYALKNDALECLLECDPLPEQLPEAMEFLVLSDEQDVLWREYVLQHFGMLYERIRSEELMDKANIRYLRMCQKILADCLKDKTTGLSGTALLVIRNLMEKYPEFGRANFILYSKDLAGDMKTELSSRITALAVLGEVAPEHARAPALEIINSPDLPVTLRLASVRSLKGLYENDMEVRSALSRISGNGRFNRSKSPVLQKATQRVLEK